MLKSMCVVLLQKNKVDKLPQLCIEAMDDLMFMHDLFLKSNGTFIICTHVLLLNKKLICCSFK